RSDLSPRKPRNAPTAPPPITSEPDAGGLCRSLDHVKAAGEAIDRVDEALRVDEYVVDLDRSGRGSGRRGRNEMTYLSRLEGIADVECAHPRVEERSEDLRLGTPRGRSRIVLVDVVRAEPSAWSAVVLRGRERRGRARHDIGLDARVHHPPHPRMVLAMIGHGLVRP